MEEKKFTDGTFLVPLTQPEMIFIYSGYKTPNYHLLMRSDGSFMFPAPVNKDFDVDKCREATPLERRFMLAQMAAVNLVWDSTYCRVREYIVAK